MASLTERLADAVMKTIETEGRINRDDLIQAMHGVLATNAPAPTLPPDVFMTFSPPVDPRRAAERKRLRDNIRADAEAFDKWCLENINRLAVLPFYGAFELQQRAREIYEAEKANAERVFDPPAFIRRDMFDRGFK